MLSQYVQKFSRNSAKKLRLSIAHRLRKKYTHSGSKDDGKQLSIAARTCNSLRIVHSSRCLLEADQWNIGRTTHGARQYSERSGDTLEPCNEPCHLSNPEKERFHWKRIAPLQAVRSESIPKFRALLSSTHESVFRANHAVHENSWGIPDLLLKCFHVFSGLRAERTFEEEYHISTPWSNPHNRTISSVG